MSEYALAHHGIKGQKWGIRRYENPDGSLTAAGRARYGRQERSAFRKDSRQQMREANQKLRSGQITKDSKEYINAKRDRLVSRYGSGEDIYNYKKGNKDAKNAAIKSAGTRKAGSIATKAALATAGTAATVGTAVGAAAILSALAKVGLVSAIGTTGAVATGVGLGLANGKVKSKESSSESKTKFNVKSEEEMLKSFNDRHPVSPKVSFENHTEQKNVSSEYKRPEKMTVVNKPGVTAANADRFEYDMNKMHERIKKEYEQNKRR